MNKNDNTCKRKSLVNACWKVKSIECIFIEKMAPNTDKNTNMNKDMQRQTRTSKNI